MLRTETPIIMTGLMLITRPRISALRGCSGKSERSLRTGEIWSLCRAWVAIHQGRSITFAQIQQISRLRFGSHVAIRIGIIENRRCASGPDGLARHGRSSRDARLRGRVPTLRGSPWPAARWSPWLSIPHAQDEEQLPSSRQGITSPSIAGLFANGLLDNPPHWIDLDLASGTGRPVLRSAV